MSEQELNLERLIKRIETEQFRSFDYYFLTKSEVKEFKTMPDKIKGEYLQLKAYGSKDLDIDIISFTENPSLEDEIIQVKVVWDCKSLFRKSGQLVN